MLSFEFPIWFCWLGSESGFIIFFIAVQHASGVSTVLRWDWAALSNCGSRFQGAAKFHRQLPQFTTAMPSDSGSDIESIDLPKELSTLLSHVEARPESFLHGDAEIQSAALSATKFLFDRGAFLPSLYDPVITC